MSTFQITAPGTEPIRFLLYESEAPKTCRAFLSLLPFTQTLFHARVSGQEIWSDAAPPLDVPQENCTVFTRPGELVYGPSRPARNKTANCMGIYYGEGKGLDACNVFGRVHSEDAGRLQALGEAIWKEGAREISFEKCRK